MKSKREYSLIKECDKPVWRGWSLDWFRLLAGDKLAFRITTKTAEQLRYAFCAIAAVALLLLFAFTILSDFSYDLFYKVRYSEVFFDMWKRLVVGDVTIDPSLLFPEFFIINGRTIPYQLPLPAVVRGVLSIFGLGRHSIPSLLFAALLCSASVYFLFNEVLIVAGCRERKAVLTTWYPFLLLPMVSMFVEASDYWESILWAFTLFITQGFLFIALTTSL